MVLNTLQYRIEAEDNTEEALRSFGNRAEQTFDQATQDAQKIGDALQEGISDEAIEATENRLGAMFERVAAAAGAAFVGIFEALDRIETLRVDVSRDIGGAPTDAEIDLIQRITASGAVSREDATAGVRALRGQRSNLGLEDEGQAAVVGLLLGAAENLEEGTSQPLARLLNRFNIQGADNVGSAIELLFQQSAGAGVSIGEVLQAFDADARPLREFGLELPAATQLITSTLNTGLDFGAVGGGLEEARIRSAEEGIQPLALLQDVEAQIRNASSANQAFQIAVDWFGETDAFGVVEAIRRGSLSFNTGLLVDRSQLHGGNILTAVGLTTAEAGQAILDTAGLEGGALGFAASATSLLGELPFVGDVFPQLVGALFGDAEFPEFETNPNEAAFNTNSRTVELINTAIQQNFDRNAADRNAAFSGLPALLSNDPLTREIFEREGDVTAPVLGRRRDLLEPPEPFTSVSLRDGVQTVALSDETIRLLTEALTGTAPIVVPVTEPDIRPPRSQVSRGVNIATFGPR